MGKQMLKTVKGHVRQGRWAGGHRACVQFVFSFLLFCVLSGACFAEETLDPHLLQGVYAGQSLSDVEKEALQQLQSGVKKLYGVALPLLKNPQEIDAELPVVVVGREAALETGKITERELQGIQPGGHIIRSDGNGVVIVGLNSWDTRYAVYHFLEKLGVRFYLPRFNQAFFPDSPPARIPEFSISDSPDFAYRSGLSDVWRQMYYQLGDPLNGLTPEVFEKKETGSDLWIDHTAGYLVPKLLYYQKHPEYYAMREDGKRVAAESFTDHRTPLCLSNTDVSKISVERALGWVEKEKGKQFFMITYGDTGLWCQCPECRKLDSREGEYSDRLLSWVNPIAKAIGEKYPDRILMTFAYGGTDTPPQKNIPEKNVWMVGSTGLGNFPFWDHLRQQKMIPEKQVEKIDGWLKIVPDRYTVCEYQSGTYKPALIDSMVARLRYYREKGVRGIVFSYGVPRNFKTLWQYLLGRLMWDVDQDAMKLAREFIGYYYGPAAREIWSIFELAHNRYQDTLSSKATIEDLYPAGFYADAFAKEVLGYFAKAESVLSGNEKLLNEILEEERLFIKDWMRHPTYRDVNESSEKILLFQLKRLRELTGETEKERNDLAGETHKLALAVEPSRPGTVGVVEKWIAEQELFSPHFIKISNGVQLTPQSFMYAGFGPANYGYNCPPKDAVGIYVKGNSKHRSHKMSAGFELDLKGDMQTATLTLEGQASTISGLNPQISIRLNEKEIYRGTADFVKHNWSFQSYTIPVDYLQAGKNRLEIININDPASIKRWNQGWFLVSDAVIKFE